MIYFYLIHFEEYYLMQVLNYYLPGTSLAVQWFRLHASTAGGTGLIPGQGIKIPHTSWCRQKKKKKSLHILSKLNPFFP